MRTRRTIQGLSALVAALMLSLALCLVGCATTDASEKATTGQDDVELLEVIEDEEGQEAPETRAPKKTGSAKDLDLPEDGTYTSKDEVAWYLHTYGHLPSNYITKWEAEDAGWKSEGQDLWDVCPGKSIGGGKFGNYEGKLPSKRGRTWRECDIDYRGQRSRGAKRIVYSSDGLIYYTSDHYKTFERLY